ncbi:MAG: tetratricopeptide repeat protein [Anaerolineae bacterium]
MTKRRKRSRSSTNRQGAATLRTRGSNAFRLGDYNQAIETWERVHGRSPDMLPSAALAEAYFRRGQEHFAKPQPDFETGLRDLRRAVELQPEDACYVYHLGLASQRSGDLKTAIIHYEKVRQNPSSPLAHRAAYPLALALLQEGLDPTGKPVWAELTDHEKGLLRAAIAFRRRPYALAEDAPPLWQGLVALDASDDAEAQRLLHDALQAPNSPTEAHIIRYYLGVLAARAEDWDTARKLWTQAYAGGYRSEPLSYNLGEIYHRLAEQRLLEDDAASALATANEADRHAPPDKRFAELLSQIYQRLGYQAASAGRWEQALDHWEEARRQDGGSFRLAYNLALAYEKIEDFFNAANFWREALRRRPRKDDHPDAINNEQVARLWQRTAEAYVKDGEYEEAINVYKQAVKWNPDSLETRMALVEGLINDGRFLAAENELQRILEKDENYIPALLRMGEVVAESRSWWQALGAPRYWTRILEIEPDHEAALQALTYYYLDQAENAMSWSNFQSAIESYNKALQYQPNNGYILARLGACYMWMEQQETAQSYLDQALAHSGQDLRVYEQIIHVWLDKRDPERAGEVLRQAEAAIKDIPVEFYLAQAIYAMEVDVAMGPPWLDRAVDVSPPADEPLAKIGQLLALSTFTDVAQAYLERAIAAGQEVVRCWTSLAMLALRRGDSQAARGYVRDAEKAARKSKNPEDQQQIKMIRDMLDIPPGLLNMMIHGLGSGMLDGPGGMPLLPDFMDDFDDDEEWNDD